MIALLGNYSLTFAALAAAAGMLGAIYAARFDQPRMLTFARIMLTAMAGLFILASIALCKALFDNAFQFEYVTSYSEIALPTGYKFAAFWAGQAGSLLLWALILALMSALAGWQYRDTSLSSEAAVLATLLIVGGFFAMLMLFAANPFAMLPAGEVPPDGRGLNPMLQDPGMIIHPPLLFIGYAGFTIPFAIMIGALVAGHRDNAWITATRRWSLFSWLFLSLGILLGAQWAYVELGWGGYWAWDPVENASLLPWLTGTAMLHSIMVQARRGMFKRWNVVLIAVTFILCIFGTYLTRSGVVGSVHSFGKSMVGNFFLGFLLLSIATSAGLIAWRFNRLKADAELHVLVSREGAFLAGNVLLMVITATTLIGTIFPLISTLFVGREIVLDQNFYNKIVIPMSLLLLGLMAMGPVLKAGPDAPAKMGRVIIAPTVAGVVGAAIALLIGVTNFWALGCVFVTIASLYSLVADFSAAVMLRVKNTGENAIAGAIRLMDSDHRRYGGQLTHVGMIMIAIGVTGSSLYNSEHQFTLREGEQLTHNGYSFTLDKLHQVRHANFDALEAVVTMTAPDGHVAMMTPQLRVYDKWQQQRNSEVAYESDLQKDVYMTLAGGTQTATGLIATLEVKINPLVAWIWIGGLVLTVGGILCMLPRLLPQHKRAAANQPHPQTAS